MCYGKEKLEFVKGKHRSCFSRKPAARREKRPAKAAGSHWNGTEAAETERYLNELKADIMPIDQLIGFAGSEAGIQYFGEAAAKGIVSHAEEIKANGARYCDCPACAAARRFSKAGDTVKRHQSSSSVLYF